MANGTGGLSEFLNPKSMLTPGVAGGTVLTITNTLGTQFGLPLAWTALILSALVGTLVFAAAIPVLQRVVLYLLNSLVIFCVAMGSNAAGQQTSAKAERLPASVAREEPVPTSAQSPGFFRTWQF